MSDVFVSYKAEDKRRVRPLVEALREDGLSVWWDEQVGGGAAWRHAIEAELNAAACAIVVWSKRSVAPEGEFVQDEAARAKLRHSYLPVMIDQVQLPLGFGETQALPLVSWQGKRSDPRYQAIVAAVRQRVGQVQSEPASPAPKGGIDRRAAMAAGVILAAAAAGAGAWKYVEAGASDQAPESIAVLPFENLSDDRAQSYFADGVAEEIRSALARLSGLTVIGRSSSEAVRNDDARTAARKLNVRNILSGTVRQSPSTIRITAELVDGRTGADRWSEDYSRSPGDAISIQSDIAQNVANALSIQLLPATRRTLLVGGTTNPLAHDAYLQGLALAAANGDEQLDRQALRQFDAAIAHDPRYADAYASKAELLTIVAFLDPTDAGTRADLGKALVAARAAVRLAPAHSNSQSALGVVLQNLNDFQDASRSFENAIRLGADAETLRRVALFRARLGSGSAALELLKRAHAIDPLNENVQADVGIALFYSRNYEAAINALSSYVHNQPNSSRVRDFLLRSLLLAGRTSEAEAELPKIETEWMRLVDDALVKARSGDRRSADLALSRVIALHSDLVAFQMAEIHAQRNEIDMAIHELRKAVALRDAGLQALPSDPFLDPLRSDPRFRSLVSQLDFPQR